MPGRNPFKKRHDRHDFERDQIVTDYDPTFHGFAYPHTVQAPDLHPSCTCILQPSKQHGESEPVISFCDFCLGRLRSASV